MGLSGNLSAQNTFQKRYVRYQGDMSNNTDVTRLQNIIQQAAQAGYNGIVLADAGVHYLHDQSTAYTNNLATIRSSATSLGLAIIPDTFYQTNPALVDPYTLSQDAYVSVAVYKLLMNLLSSDDAQVVQTHLGTSEDGIGKSPDGSNMLPQTDHQILPSSVSIDAGKAP